MPFHDTNFKKNKQIVQDLNWITTGGDTELIGEHLLFIILV